MNHICKLCGRNKGDYQLEEVPIKDKLICHECYEVQEYKEKLRLKENTRRKSLGLPLVGYKYKREEELFKKIKIILPQVRVYNHYGRAKKDFLDGLEIDIYIPSLNLAIEHNGKQHYELVKRFHKSQEDLEKQILRDKKLSRLCGEKSIKLITISYKEPLELDYIKNKIAQSGLCEQR